MPAYWAYKNLDVWSFFTCSIEIILTELLRIRWFISRCNLSILGASAPFVGGPSELLTLNIEGTSYYTMSHCHSMVLWLGPHR